MVEITIADDGVGFDPSKPNGNGDGLRNLETRLHKLTDTIEWQSAPGQGTTVRMNVPLQIS